MVDSFTSLNFDRKFEISSLNEKDRGEFYLKFDLSEMLFIFNSVDVSYAEFNGLCKFVDFYSINEESSICHFLSNSSCMVVNYVRLFVCFSFNSSISYLSLRFWF